MSPDRISGRAGSRAAVRPGPTAVLPRRGRAVRGSVDVDVAPTDQSRARARRDPATPSSKTARRSAKRSSRRSTRSRRTPASRPRAAVARPKYPRLPFSAIVLLSDGSTNSGRPDGRRPPRPRDGAGVPVSTIAFGTDHGMLDAPGAVPVDNETARAIADAHRRLVLPGREPARAPFGVRQPGLPARLPHRAPRGSPSGSWAPGCCSRSSRRCCR